MKIQFLGAAGSVTGSCFLIETRQWKILLDCGQIQGRRVEEEANRAELPVPLGEIDAVILSHAHIDHSGRLPWLRRIGYTGPIYTHHATRALCDIMLIDSAYLHEKDAEWANRKRRRKGLPDLEPLYDRADAEAVLRQFKGSEYGEKLDPLPGLAIRFSDAGHILGAAIIELWIDEANRTRKLVFSGDLGYEDAPVMENPAVIREADYLLLESTYGDRDHKSFDATLDELRSIFIGARDRGGNILIPAFAVGRTQDLLYLMTEYYDEWGLGDWKIYLDSPMAIEATDVYSRYRYLYGASIFQKSAAAPKLPNFVASRSAQESMALNSVRAGAIIIAGSGMCSGGRILHHLKHNLWREDCDVIFVGFQAYGTLGRKLVDGARYVRLWNEAIKVNASIHTVGGLSAHADRSGLIDWYGGFDQPPPVSLMHGEDKARRALQSGLRRRAGVTAHLPSLGEEIEL